MSKITVSFWGTRGSLPAALTADDVHEKIVHALHAAADRKSTRLNSSH